MKKDRLLHPARGFYVIVPVEKQLTGNPDPSWFIDALMKFYRQPYYVALLSAASFHGSAHQAPQEFQIMTNAQLKPIRVGRARIRFLKKSGWNERLLNPLKRLPEIFLFQHRRQRRSTSFNTSVGRDT